MPVTPGATLVLTALVRRPVNNREKRSNPRIATLHCAIVKPANSKEGLRRNGRNSN